MVWAYHEQNVYRQLNSLTSDRMNHSASFQTENVNQLHHERNVVRFGEIVDSNDVPNLRKPSYIYCLCVLGPVGYPGIGKFLCMFIDCCWEPSDENVSILLSIFIIHSRFYVMLMFPITCRVCHGVMHRVLTEDT